MFRIPAATPVHVMGNPAAGKLKNGACLRSGTPGSPFPFACWYTLKSLHSHLAWLYPFAARTSARKLF